VSTKVDLSRLGVGVYSIAEVARLVEMPYSTARAWYIEKNRQASQILHTDYAGVDGQFVVSFLDLIDANAVRQFRSANVSFAIIRRSYEILSEQLSTSHPFAHSDLDTDGKRILVDASAQIGDASLSDVIDRQGFFYEMRNRLKHVEYDEGTKLASRWPIFKDVLIDPDVAYGKPAIDGTSTLTSVISRQYFANGEDAELVADLFSVSESQVLNAMRFERSIWNRQAA